MNFNPFTSISSHQPTRHSRSLTSCPRRSETSCHDGEVRSRPGKLEVSPFPGVVCFSMLSRPDPTESTRNSPSICCFPSTARCVSTSSLTRTLKSSLETRVGSLVILPPNKTNPHCHICLLINSVSCVFFLD